MVECFVEVGIEFIIMVWGEEWFVKVVYEMSERYGIIVMLIVVDLLKEEGRCIFFEVVFDLDILVIIIKLLLFNGDFFEFELDVWCELLEMILFGLMEIMCYYILGMKECGWGCIVNIVMFFVKNLMIWCLFLGLVCFVLFNYIVSVLREIVLYGVMINNLFFGMFVIEGVSDLMFIYVVVFGFEFKWEVVSEYF